MINLMQLFVRATGYLPQKAVFRTKLHYEDRRRQSRYIKGSAIIVSNHTAVYDYAQFLFVFMNRTLRYQMAEILFQKQPLGTFLKLMGGIQVDRGSTELGFMAASEQILKKGGVVGIFPEGRLPREGEVPPIDFKPGAAFLAMVSGAKVIPVYTDGNYFNKKRAHVVIGAPMYARDYYDENKSEKDNIALFTKALRDKIIELRGSLNG